MSVVPITFQLLLLSSVQYFSEKEMPIYWPHLREIKVKVEIELRNVTVFGCKRLGETAPPLFSFFVNRIFRFGVLTDLVTTEFLDFNLSSLGYLDCGHLSICTGMCEIQADVELYLTVRKAWKLVEDVWNASSSDTFWSRFFSSDVVAIASTKLRSSKFSSSFIDAVEPRIAKLDESFENCHICYVVRGYSAHLHQIHNFSMSLMSHARASGSFVDVFFVSTDATFDDNLYDEYKHAIDGMNNLLHHLPGSTSAQIHLFPSTAWRHDIHRNRMSERRDTGYRQFDVTDYALSTISGIARAFKSKKFCEYIYISNSDNVIRQPLHAALSGALDRQPSISFMFFKAGWRYGMLLGGCKPFIAFLGNWVAKREILERLSFIEAYVNFCKRTQSRCAAYMADGSLMFSILPAQYSPVSCSELDTCHLTLRDEELLDLDGCDETARYYATLN